jgi:phage baseplate assembly protein W
MPTPTPFYPLSPSTPTPPTSPGVAPSSPTPAASFQEFLGYGLVAPFQRDQKQDFASAGGVELVKACVAEIIGTQCAADAAGVVEQGELEWRPEFGALLRRMLHRKGSILQELAQYYIAAAIARWEPRVQVTATRVDHDPTSRVMTIFVRYNIIDKNVPGNAVLVQDVEQTISLPMAA